MLITICAILVSSLLIFFFPGPLDLKAHYLAMIILVGSTSVFLITLFLNTFILMPFTYLQQQLVPNLMDLVKRDKPLRMGRTYLFSFILVSYCCVAFISVVEETKHHWFFLIWFIFFGVSLDVLCDSWKRMVHLLNPSFLVSRIASEAEKAIQNENKNALLSELNYLAEIGLHSVEKSKLALSTQTLQALPPLLKIYFDSAKSIGHTSFNIKDQQNLQEGDPSSFIVFYLLQRLELINDKALRDRQETVCRQMIMTMGKMIIHCGQFDLSMISFPTHFLTKFGLKAQQHYFDEVTVLTTSTLLEVAKTILAGVDVTYAELQSPFQAIINGLAAIARSSFKKQKDTSIKVLMQPLVDLKALFKTEKMVHYKDTSTILQQIDNVLDEFSALEQVMYSIPPLPETEI